MFNLKNVRADMLSAVNEYQGLRHIIEETATLEARKEALEASQDFILIAFHYSQRKRVTQK